SELLLESPTDIALLGGNVPRSEIAKSAAQLAIIPYPFQRKSGADPSIADAVSAPTVSLKLIMRRNEPSDLGCRLVPIGITAARVAPGGSTLRYRKPLGTAPSIGSCPVGVQNGS